MNFDALTGAPGLVSVILFSAMVVLAIASYAYSKYLEKNKPEVYGRIGRQDFVDMDEVPASAAGEGAGNAELNEV